MQKCINIYMSADELIRKLKRLGNVTVIPTRGKGGHVRVARGDRITHIPTGGGDLKTGLVHGILRQPGLTMRDLR
jgi:predicted RNA binding protein YcfA (HicA-like mRNA interferase family)